MKNYIYFFIVSLSLFISKAENLPNLDVLKEKIKNYNFYDPKDVEIMSKIQSHSCGLWYWKSSFIDVYNSDLLEEEQNKLLALLLAVGIVQIDSKDKQFINSIKTEMDKWSENDKKSISKEELGFTFEDLATAFKSKSTSVNPTGSDIEI